MIHMMQKKASSSFLFGCSKENLKALQLLEEERQELQRKKEERRILDLTQAQTWADERQMTLDRRRKEAQLRDLENQRRAPWSDLVLV